jgi:restriction endonuclease S subunit
MFMMIDTKALRQKIIELAVSGKLVPQDPSDEPAAVLLERIKQEKSALIKQGKLKAAKADSKDKQNCDSSYYENLSKNSPSNNRFACVCFGDVAEINTGATFRKDQASGKRLPGNVRVLRGGNISAGSWDKLANDLFLDRSLVSEEMLLKKGDIITPAVTSLENVGKAALISEADEEMVVGGFVFYIRDLLQDIVLPEWIYLYFQSSDSQKSIRKITKKSGSAFYNINKSLLTKTRIEVPSIKTQIEIIRTASVLLKTVSEISIAVSKYEKTKTALKQKILSLAISGKLVNSAPIDGDDKNYYKNLSRDWPEKTLSEIADCFIGLTYKPVDIVPQNGTTILRSNNIQGGRLFLPGTIEVTTRIPDKLFLRDDDILICSRNGSSNLVGKCCLISGLTKKASFGAFMTVCRVFSGLPKFIYYFMQSGKFRSQIRPNANTTTINQLTTNILKNVKIPFPPIEQQEKVVGKLDKLSLLLTE